MKNFKVFLLVVVLIVMSGYTPARADGDDPTIPYGLSIAPGVELKGVPEPYNSKAHGKPIDNMSLKANLTERSDFKLPERHIAVTSFPEIEPGSGDRGLWLHSKTGEAGIHAENTAGLKIKIPNSAVGTTIYAPTHMPPGGTCIETVTAHWRYNLADPTYHGHGFWDWCGTDGSLGWQNFELMDASWQNKYLRSFSGELRYWTTVYEISPETWVGMLYNFNEGQWEVKTTISGTTTSSVGLTGWSMWESHYLMDGTSVCPNFPPVKARNLKVFQNGTWVKVNNTNSEALGPYGRCWENQTYTFVWRPASSTWISHTPN